MYLFAVHFCIVFHKEKIKNYADTNPEIKWIRGSSWEQDLLGRFPTKEDLDAVCSVRPVILERACQHLWVVNTKVLEMTGEINFPMNLLWLLLISKQLKLLILSELVMVKVCVLKGLMKSSSVEELLEYYPDGHEKFGEPTGIVYEKAFPIIHKICVVSKEEKLTRIKKGVEACVRNGLTAVHSNEGQMWEEYCELANNNQVNL